MNPSSSSSSSTSASSSSFLIKRKRDSTCSDDETEQPNCKRLKNDLFINYSFEDIGNGFISHLKGSPSLSGLTVSDHKDLQVGQNMCSELLKAINESETYLVVFSPGYASSLRSLDELVDIMKCRGERTVYPVFYKVEPTEVRNQQGSCKKAFQDYDADGEVNPERVQNWKKGLKDACELAGSTLMNDRDEGTFVSEIVEKLWEMQKSQDLHVTDYPVGIRSRVEELMSLLRLDCDGVLVFSVSGISGIGKTTIVKAMYNEIASKFNARCFLEDIHRRYNGRGDWKLKLQKDLISQITNDGKVKLRCDAVEKIRKLLGCTKTLLVLDDVQKFEQLEGLGINSLRFFYKGSRIIVTTRDVDSLGGIQHTSYHTRLLNARESRKLFIRLMFARDEPIHAKFVEEVVARAGGLPLVLKVWSRHFTQYKEHLPAALKTLKQIPHGDVQKQLQMSYDSLSPESKNLFLDIACFFDGWDKSLVSAVLNDDGFDLDYEIEKLAHKFLVENQGTYVSLPDVIKEMGHEVVRQENPEEPGQRTRLMGHRDVVRVFQEYSGTYAVRSIQLNDDNEMEEEATVQFEAFRKMGNLRFIKLDNPNLLWSSSSNDDMSACFSFKHLKYIEFTYNFPCKSLDNIDMGNVVVIKLLHGSKLEKLWDGVKNFKKLKILNVRYSHSLIKTGNFIGLKNLEELYLCNCDNLEELDSSIGCLQKLVLLDLSRCTRLKRFPWEMICKLTTLQKLNLYHCSNIPEISHEIGSLKHLNLRNTKLHQLTKIDLRYCTNLKSIPDLPLSIKELTADGCKNLVNLPSNCSELQNLKELWLNECFKLGSEGFTQVTRLRNLQELHMQNCNVSQVSSGIGNLVSLSFLDLSHNTFSSLPESFSNLSKLEQLRINDCSELQLLPPLPSQLKNIYAHHCRSIDVMSFDSMQKAYTFHSKMFKGSLTSTERLHIRLSGEELPEWCTYRNSGNTNVLSFEAPIRFDSKICGLILCAIYNWPFSTIHNKTKEKSHCIETRETLYTDLQVMFYPLNDKTVVVEAGDTVVLQLRPSRSWGLRFLYEDDVADSGLVLKGVREPLFLTSETMTCNDDDDDDDHDDDIVMSSELHLV